MIAHRHVKQGLIGLVMMVAFASAAIAQPATQPARPNFGGGLGAAGGGRGGQFFDRFHDVVYELNLTADQKTKIDAAFEKAKDDIQQMLPQTQGLSPQERQEKVRDVVQNLREQVRGVLTKEQAATLREKMEALRAAAGGQAGAQGGALGGGRFGNAAGSAANAGAAQPQNNATPPAKPAISAAGGAAANGASANGAGRLDAIVQRLQDSIATLNLSGDQKSQVQTIVDDGKKQLADMREKVESGQMQPAEVRDQAPQILAAMRDQLAGVLTKDQQEQLRDAIETRARNASNSENAESMAAAPATQPAMMMQKNPDPFGDAERPAQPTQPDTSGPAAGRQALTPPDKGPKVGEAAPAFVLQTLNDRTVQLSSFKNKPVVIEFGSYSSPSFRQRAAAMEALQRQYDMRADFLIIYTKEAHPVGGWEVDRNKDDNIRISNAGDMNARTIAARDAKQALKITIPIALDSMDDKTASAYGAGENTGLIVGRDGKIAAKENWCDAFRLRAALEDVLGKKVASAN